MKPKVPVGLFPWASCFAVSQRRRAALWRRMTLISVRFRPSVLSRSPCTDWWLRRWLLRWRRHADEVLRRRDWTRVWTVPVPLPGRRSVVASASTELAALSTDVLGVPTVTLAEVGGCSGRQARREGVWRARDAAEGEAHAWRLWARAGGAQEMRLEEDVRRRARDARLAAELVAARGGRPSDELRAEMAAWLQEVRPGGTRRPERARHAMWRRSLRNDMVAAGVACDGRRRWAVEAVLDWRGSGRRREALVQWRGFDVEGGQCWEPSWVPRGWLTADLRKLGNTRSRKRSSGADGHRREEVAAAAARRKSPRLAGVAPVGDLSGAQRCKRRRPGLPATGASSETGTAVGGHGGEGRAVGSRGQDAVFGLVQGEGRRVSARLWERGVIVGVGLPLYAVRGSRRGEASVGGDLGCVRSKSQVKSRFRISFVRNFVARGGARQPGT